METWIGMAWAIEEHDDAAEVLEGCLLVAAGTAEEAYELIGQEIELCHPGEDPHEAIEGYHISVRRAK